MVASQMLPFLFTSSKIITHYIPPTQAFKLAADRKLFLPSMPRVVQEDGATRGVTVSMSAFLACHQW